MRNKLLVVMILMMMLLITAGCGGGPEATRQPGLSPEAVIHSFFDAAKANRLSEAALYVSPASKNDAQTLIKFVTGQDSATLKNATLLSANVVTQQGNYAAALAMLKTEKVLPQPQLIGLEKINGEWYIVDYDQIFRDAKYQVLAQLLAGIKF